MYVKKRYISGYAVMHIYVYFDFLLIIIISRRFNSMKIVKVCIINAMLLLAIILVGSFGVFAESIANDYYITIEPKDVTIEGTNHLYKEVTIKLYLVNNTDSPYQTATGSQIPSQIKFDSTNPKVAYIENGKLYSGSSAGTTVITATCDPYGNGTMIRTVKTNVNRYKCNRFQSNFNYFK
jgi:hypothetical protein